MDHNLNNLLEDVLSPDQFILFILLQLQAKGVGTESFVSWSKAKHEHVTSPVFDEACGQ